MSWARAGRDGRRDARRDRHRGGHWGGRRGIRLLGVVAQRDVAFSDAVIDVRSRPPGRQHGIDARGALVPFVPRIPRATSNRVALQDPDWVVQSDQLIDVLVGKLGPRRGEVLLEGVVIRVYGIGKKNKKLRPEREKWSMICKSTRNFDIK